MRASRGFVSISWASRTTPQKTATCFRVVNELMVTTRTTSSQHCSNRHLFPQLRFLVHGDISVQQSINITVFQRVTTDRKHVLHDLIPLPPVASQNYNLRQRRHNLELSSKSGLWFWNIVGKLPDIGMSRQRRVRRTTVDGSWSSSEKVLQRCLCRGCSIQGLCVGIWAS